MAISLSGAAQRDRARAAFGADGGKERNCLRCAASFASAWSGERICPRCKGTTAWRTGEPFRVAARHGNR